MNCLHDGCGGSVMTDGFCDTCGRRPGTASGSLAAEPDRPATTAAGGAASCPDCGASRDPAASFCEACGFDFVKRKAPSMPVIRPSMSTDVPLAPSATDPDRGAEPQTANPTGSPTEAPADVEWLATVETDPTWYAHFCETWQSTHGEPCPVAFPGERQRVVPVSGPVVVIGRHAAGIDLALDPNDAAVSHRHASLIRQPDGIYALTDLDSSNGTYVEGQPVAKGQTADLADGGSFTVGAFTRITLNRVAR